MNTPVLPPATLGMLGGGQLGRYFVHAAHELGYKVWVLDPDPHSPAGRVADRHLAVAYDDAAALQELGTTCAAITTEFENVPAATLDTLAQRTRVHPSAAAIAVCQSRIAEKDFLARNGLPHGPYAVIRSAADIDASADTLYPAILKAAQFGYDGKGQARVANRAEAQIAWRAMGEQACVLEKMLTLDYELSVVLARAADGAVQAFTAGENSHRDGILDITIAPANRPAPMLAAARQAAERVATALGYVGTLGVEFFISDGQLLVNEIAPRPHNSGHHTLDACDASQFEQQVRALCGLALAPVREHSPAIMVNLLGDLWFEGVSETPRKPDWAALLAIAGLNLHLYGKHEARRSRKMGHFTLTGDDAEELVERMHAARRLLGLPPA